MNSPNFVFSCSAYWEDKCVHFQANQEEHMHIMFSLSEEHIYSVFVRSAGTYVCFMLIKRNIWSTYSPIRKNTILPDRPIRTEIIVLCLLNRKHILLHSFFDKACRGTYLLTVKGNYKEYYCHFDLTEEAHVFSGKQSRIIHVFHASVKKKYDELISLRTNFHYCTLWGTVMYLGI